QPGNAAKPGDKNKKEGEDASKKKEADTTVKRPEKPPRVPDPREFNVKLDPQGRVPPFNFIGQPWPDVMQWLASLSKCTLDWQELPNDYLNLTTDRAYPLDEVQDRINRALQARGFTSIKAKDVLSVFKIDKIDPSLVPRAEEEKLYDLKPYDFAKVSFELPTGMEVDKAKDEVKQVLSPTAKVFPLVSSHRLLIMDSVANLRGVSELLNTERMVEDGRIVPKEFVLKYARPQQVIDVLYMMVGVDPNAKPAQPNPQMQQQQMQMMQQMQARGQNVPNLMQKSEPKVYLAYNRQRNSVLVNAPPEQMKIIEQTIKYLDVPFGVSGTPAADTVSSGDTQRTMKKYNLATLDPDKFVATLEEIGGLSPYAEFKTDDNSKTLFVLATESDHKKIQSLLDQFDGTGRHFEVVTLRRLPADAVAATIYKLMAGQNEKKDDNRRRYGWWWDDYNQNDKKNDTVQGFGVDADIENNRLLLWANDVELQRVRELLAKLGETLSGQQDARTVRMIEPTDGKSTAELLKELREAWSASGGNPLIINAPAEPKGTPPSDDDQKKKEKPNSDKATTPKNDRSAGADQRTRIIARLAAIAATSVADVAMADTDKQKGAGAPSMHSTDKSSAPAQSTNSAQSEMEKSKTAGTRASVTITVTPDGRIMLSSPDTAALDRLENLIEQLSPPQRRFKVYHIKYVSAFDIYLDLKNYFKEELEGESSGYTRDWYGFMIPKGKEDNTTGLGKRRKLMLDYDPPSNSVIVANASASQLAEVEQLIAEFDQPPRSDSVEKRTTKAIKIVYSRPTVIAAAVKEVYRDLLSSRDKEFDRGDQKDKRGNTERVTVINYGGSGGDESDDRSSSVKLGFDGALSLGADDVSGVLIVSAQQGIFPDIERMVHELDEQAAPKNTVKVFRLDGTVSAESLQKALDSTVGKAWLGNRPEQQPSQTGPESEKKNAGKEHGNHNGHREKND
ncbi:MAG TPA: secretin N-terminal domain-containing protein, partial [Lacipirellulaceae bacterium]|nr:secretin N-terminal domain-containing protein [Lacipirellulaceae bacterium]